MKTLLILSLILSSTSLLAGPKKSPKKSGGHKISYHWYDGNQKRIVWLNNELISEFAEESVVKASVATAQPVRGDFGVAKIWRLPRTQTSTQMSQRLNVQHAQSAVSPVFHERNAAKASMLALPVDVIVVFNEGWSEAQIRNWADSYRLTIVEQLAHTKNAYLIESAPGLASIATANRIFETGQVVSSTPNWWKEREAK
jgi:hypothetical protein